MGWEYTILSLEPESADPDSVDRIRRRTESAGIRWRHRPYRPGRVGAVRNSLSMAALVREAATCTDLFHCRSYFGAFFPAALDTIHRTPYVFDTRGYWVDEKIEGGRWFQHSATRGIARLVERGLYRGADGVVSLTELAAADVRAGRFGASRKTVRSICIPTCVDYKKFRIQRDNPPHEFLRLGPIIGYVGSLNPAYEGHKSLELVAMILDRVPGAKFLALTSQLGAMISLADKVGIATERRLVTTVPHEQIPRWLPWLDFGLIFRVTENLANRASMPTKLAEFLATGVAPIGYGGNSDFTAWLERPGSGLVLTDLSSGSLARAAEWAAHGRPDAEVLARARSAAEAHFSLDSGARRYDGLFREILS